VTPFEAIGVAVALLGSLLFGWVTSKRTDKRITARMDYDLLQQVYALVDTLGREFEISMVARGEDREVEVTVPLEHAVFLPQVLDCPLDRPHMKARIGSSGDVDFGARRLKARFFSTQAQLWGRVAPADLEFTVEHFVRLALTAERRSREPLDRVATERGYFRDGTKILGFPAELSPTCVRVSHGLGLPFEVRRHGRKQVGHPLLDMLVSVDTEQPERSLALLDPVVEPLLALVHGHPGSHLGREVLEVDLESPPNDAGWEELFDHVEALLSGLTDCQPPDEGPDTA